MHACGRAALTFVDAEQVLDAAKDEANVDLADDGLVRLGRRLEWLDKHLHPSPHRRLSAPLLQRDSPKHTFGFSFCMLPVLGGPTHIDDDVKALHIVTLSLQHLAHDKVACLQPLLALLLLGCVRGPWSVGALSGLDAIKALSPRAWRRRQRRHCPQV
jgi:hypothetical protein